MTIAAQQKNLNPDEILKIEFWNAVVVFTNGLHREKDHTLSFVMNEAARDISKKSESLTEKLIIDTCQKRYGKGKYSYSALIIPYLKHVHQKLTTDRDTLKVA